MFIRKKVIGIIVLLALVIAICYVRPYKDNEIISAISSQNHPQIILDAGHGGFDGGAVAEDGTVEKDINLKLCTLLCSMLRDCGYEVILTREGDVSTDDSEAKNSSRKRSDLKNRLELMNKYPDAVFVSIHLNKFTTSAARGSQVFYSGNNDESKVLADSIQSSIIGMLQPENKRVNKQATSSTYLIYNATVPAVLVECGFLSNKSELEHLKNEDYQNKMAFCIFCGISEFFSNIKEI